MNQNYETFLEEQKPLNKNVKDSAASIVSIQKKIQKNIEIGNLTEARKQLETLQNMVDLLKQQSEALQLEFNTFDTQDYFVSGEFTQQMLEACEQKEIDVKGEKGIYEMFPYKIRIYGDDEHQGEVWLDRKKIQSCRPVQVAQIIKDGQTRLFAAKFNVQSFMNELAEAYEITCLRSNARLGSNQSLTKVYKNLVLTARARKDYDMQAFAFDLSRAYELGPEAWITKNGTSFDFGTSREGSGIRVLSSTGVEYYISTIHSKNTITE